jgi:hypothetical protein
MKNKLVVMYVMLCLFAVNVFAINVIYRKPEIIHLQPGQVFTIPGTSDAEVAREAEKEKIAPWVALVFLSIFIL